MDEKATRGGFVRSYERPSCGCGGDCRREVLVQFTGDSEVARKRRGQTIFRGEVISVGGGHFLGLKDVGG